MMNKSLLNDLMTRLTGSAAVSIVAMGVLGGSQALAGIAGGKHDLSTKFIATAGATEICVFCHTPHGADINPGRPPLWNRNNSVATYTTYNSLGSASLDGGTAAVGSISIACLSCHDGTQAMNTMINAPGSGLGGGVYAGNFAGTASVTAGAGGAAAGGRMLGIAALGQDLRNDHPVGIQYGGGLAAGPTTVYPSTDLLATAFKDPDFKAIKYGVLNTTPAWYVDTGGAGRQKTDLMLYTRTGQTVTMNDGTTALSAGNQAFVECASCHDPHSSNTTFLRISNAGSAVCLSCHNK